MNTSIKTPWHLWAVGIFAVLFNSVGVFDFVMASAQGADYMTKAGMSPEQAAHYLNMPAWMTVVWATGVFGAFIASVMLLMRKKSASTVFVVSLAAFLLSLVYHYFLSDGAQFMGQQELIVNGVITVLLVLFIVYAQSMAKRGVLR